MRMGRGIRCVSGRKYISNVNHIHIMISVPRLTFEMKFNKTG